MYSFYFVSLRFVNLNYSLDIDSLIDIGLFHEDVRWRHLTNTTERCVCGVDAAV